MEARPLVLVPLAAGARGQGRGWQDWPPWCRQRPSAEGPRPRLGVRRIVRLAFTPEPGDLRQRNSDSPLQLTGQRASTRERYRVLHARWGIRATPRRGSAGLAVASRSRRQREAWRPPLTRPRTGSGSEASDATAKAEPPGAIAARRPLPEGRRTRRTGWDPRGKAPSQLLEPRIRQSGKAEWTGAPLASAPSSAHELPAPRGSGLWPDGDAALGVRGAVRRAPEPAGTSGDCHADTQLHAWASQPLQRSDIDF